MEHQLNHHSRIEASSTQGLIPDSGIIFDSKQEDDTVENLSQPDPSIFRDLTTPPQKTINSNLDFSLQRDPLDPNY